MSSTTSSNTSSPVSQTKTVPQSNLLLFEAIFKYKEIGESFHAFLKGDRSDEGWSYIVAVSKLKGLENDKKAFETKVKDIMKNFLESNSSKSVNISAEVRKACLVALSKDMSLAPLITVKKHIVTEMKHDSFKRYLRSKECAIIMNKYHSHTDIVVPAITDKFTYNDKDFCNPEITEMDLSFMDHLLKDSPDWELLSSFLDGEYGKRVGNIWYTNTNYFPNLGRLSLSKNEMMLPFSFIHVLCSFYPLSQQLKMDPFLTHHDFKKMIGKEKSHSIQIKNFHYGFPLSPRIIPEVAAAFYNPNMRTFTLIGKPCEVEEVKDHPWMQEKLSSVVSKKGEKPKNTKCMKMFEFHCTRIQQLGSDTTLLQQVSCFSLGGWAKKTSTLKAMARDRGNNLLVGLVTNLKATPVTVQISDLKRRKSYPVDAYAQLVTEYENEITEDDNSIVGPNSSEPDQSIGDLGSY
jgi:hypothetical protein